MDGLRFFTLAHVSENHHRLKQGVLHVWSEVVIICPRNLHLISVLSVRLAQLWRRVKLMFLLRTAQFTFMLMHVVQFILVNSFKVLLITGSVRPCYHNSITCWFTPHCVACLRLTPERGGYNLWIQTEMNCPVSWVL